jgi:hypothetical protein
MGREGVGQNAALGKRRRRRRNVFVSYGLVETNAESSVDALPVEARDDPLPERGGAFVPGDGGGCAEQAAVLGDVTPSYGSRLELEPDLGRVQGDGTHLRAGGRDGIESQKRREKRGIRPGGRGEDGATSAKHAAIALAVKRPAKEMSGLASGILSFAWAAKLGLGGGVEWNGTELTEEKKRRPREAEGREKKTKQGSALY